MKAQHARCWTIAARARRPCRADVAVAVAGSTVGSTSFSSGLGWGASSLKVLTTAHIAVLDEQCRLLGWIGRWGVDQGSQRAVAIGFEGQCTLCRLLQRLRGKVAG